LSSQRSIVALERVAEDVRGALRRALEAADFRGCVPRGADVALKVNLGWDLFIPGSITSPLVVEELIGAIRDHVGRIFVVESDQVLEDIEKAFALSGMAEVCRRTGARWVNLSRSETVRVEAPENVVLKELEVPRILRETVLITVPVMKTHGKTVITGALKNQFGCLSKARHTYHLVLDDVLADLNRILRPAFALMDGTIGLEGNGPKSGRPRVADLILASPDPVALDTVQALCMGLDPARIGHLASCGARGVGVCDPERIEVRGCDLTSARVPFRPARQNAVAAVETLFRRSAFRRLVFETPLFDACLFGAKQYYRLWTALRARRHWAAARAHPVYGAQWRAVDPGAASLPLTDPSVESGG
jgi:uncharacterized protein (DUF362 family)